MKKLIALLAAGSIAATITSLAATSQDVTKVAPDTSTVVFENAYVRVVRAHFEPGAREGSHTHPAGWYYVTRGGVLAVTGADGKTENWAPETGHSEWSNGEGAHTTHNVSNAPMEYLLVEVKAAPTQFPNR